MKNNKLTHVAALAALIFATTPALSTVIFDPVTGTGSVGKGDVQDAFLWNNQQLQTNAPGLQFEVINTRQWTATCTDSDGMFAQGKSGRLQTLTVTSFSIDSKPIGGGGKVNSDPRLNPQNMVTGFKLNGFKGGAGFSTGDAPPTVGSACNRGNIVGTWSVVSSGTTELRVQFGGSHRMLAVY